METNAESTAPATTGEVDSNPVEPTGEGSAPSGTEAAATTGDDTSNWTKKAQERYDALTRERYEAAARADRAEYRLQEAERRLQERESAQAKTPEVAPSSEFPTLEQHGYDEAKFNAAVASYYREAAKAEISEQLARERENQQRGERLKSWQQREAEFIKSKPDYVEKVRNAQYLPISQELQAQLQDSELGPQVALHLVENRDKALAIMAMPLAAQLREVGRIEASIEAAKAAPKVAVSQAPRPVDKIDSGDEVVSVRVDTADSDKLSDAEWARRRDAQERARLRKARSG